MPPGGAASKAVGKKFVKWLPVGKLFRAADGSTGTLIRHGSRLAGDTAGTAGRKVAQKTAWRQARGARDALRRTIKADKAKIDDLTRKAQDAARRGDMAEARRLRQEAGRLRNLERNRAKTVTGATDPETGITHSGYSHKDPNWGCAEKSAADAINAERAARGLPPKHPSEFDYSDAIDVKTGKPKPICTNCQDRIPPDRFPNGTDYYRNPNAIPPSPWEF